MADTFPAWVVGAESVTASLRALSDQAGRLSFPQFHSMELRQTCGGGAEMKRCA